MRQKEIDDAKLPSEPRREYWVVCDDEFGEPILPFDCNPGCEDDEGMLVYRSRDAAFSAAAHQENLYGIDCHAELLRDQYRQPRNH